MMLLTRRLLLHCKSNYKAVMKAISSSDNLFVTVMHMGRTILSTSFCGADSLSAVTRRISTSLPDGTGLVNIRLRNSTQGWAQIYNVCF